MNSTIEHAIALHQSGKLVEAESVYRSILDADQEHWDAWHLLGVLLSQQGHVDASAAAINTAIKGNPQNPVYYFNLANIYYTHKQSQQAIALYKQAININTGYADAYVNLIAVLLVEKQFDAADDVCRSLLRINPASALGHFLLGNVQMANHDYHAAIQSYAAAMEVKPDYIDAMLNQGNAYKRVEDYHNAIVCYRCVIDLEPDSVGAKTNLADALNKIGQIDASIQMLQALVDGGQQTTDLYYRLGQACETKGLHQRALAAYEQALLIDRRFAPAYTGSGAVYEVIHDTPRAIMNYRQAVALDRSNDVAALQLGNVLASSGDFAAAEQIYRDVLKDNPRHGGAYYLLSLIKRFEKEDVDYRAMLACLDSTALADKDRMGICFALGKVLDDCGQYEDAFNYYIQANALKRQSYQYTIDVERQRLQRLQDTFTAPLYARKKSLGLTDWSPIFVVGMPRSGTTLIESILSAHSQLQGVGELDDLRQVLGPNYDVYSELEMLDDLTVKQLAQDYQQRTHKYTHGLRPIDKMPGNFWRIGLIKILFPSAVIIHCCRDPLDTCVSIFKQHFSGAHRYAYSLAELGAYYQIYQAVMDYWQQMFPGSIYDVHYESLVSAPETEAKRLLRAAHVEWEPECIDFYQRKRSIQTVSLVQARQPVYSSSIGNWRRYGQGLGDLINSLGVTNGK